MPRRKKSPLNEVFKFALRMSVFALPLIINELTNAGLTDYAALATAVLAIVDKYQYERGSSLKLPF